METKPPVLKLSEQTVQIWTESGELFIITRADPQEYWVSSGGVTRRLKALGAESNRPSADPKNKGLENGNVISPVTGKVFKVSVKNGDRVVEGQELFGIESMKMQIPVLAPRSGQVKQCDLQVGDSIDRGKCVLVIDPEV